MFARLLQPNRRDLVSLNEREILSLAVAAEEEDGAIYAEIAERFASRYPATAKVFEGMAAEEDGHRRRLLDLYVEKFGARLVPIRREHVRGFIERKPVWLMETMSLESVRQLAFEMETAASRFYTEAAGRTTDVEVRKLLGDLAVEEREHANLAGKLEEQALGAEERASEKSEVPFDLCAARSRRADGWLGVDAGAGVRGRLRYRQHLVDLPRRARRGSGRRHLDGVYRGGGR